MEVYHNQRSVARLAALLRNLHLMGLLKEMHHHAALVAGHAPFRAGVGVKDKHACLTLHTLTDAERVKRVWTGGVGALVTAHTCGTWKEKVIEAKQYEYVAISC